MLFRSTRSVPSLPMRQVITSFAGNRAHEDGHEFIIEELSDAPYFIYLIMVAQFQSLLSPFIIMFCIPLAFTAVSYTHLDVYKRPLMHYKRAIDEIMRQKEHTLSAAEENILAQCGDCLLYTSRCV